MNEQKKVAQATYIYKFIVSRKDLKMQDKPNYYAIIPAEVRYDKELKDKAKLLYGEITALSNLYGCCFSSNKYFAELYGVSVTYISLLIKELVEKGYIKSTIAFQEGNRKRLVRYLTIVKDPYLTIVKGGIQQKLKYNNTSNNITSINNNNKAKEEILNFDWINED